MKKYIISYDLNKSGKNYDGLINAIEKYNCIKILYSTWIIKSSSSAQNIFDNLKPQIDDDDKLIIVEINTNNEQGWLNKNQWNWIND
ncbi:MAG: hypothetical protein IJ501_06565 [Bacilli bacterium]|nr:hypothetical protein [Bacilli bacterium]